MVAEVTVELSDFLNGSRKGGMPGLQGGGDNYSPSSGQLMLTST